MRKISSFIMACAMCLSMTVVGTVAPRIAVQAEETGAVELKEAPTEISTKYQKNWGYDCKISYEGNDSSWISAINKIEVNGKEYTKVDYSISVYNNTNYYVDAQQNYLLIGEAGFNEEVSDINKVVISATGYKNLVLEVNEKDTTIAIHKTHTGGVATCIEKAVCDFCGQEYGNLADHTYGDKYESDGTYHWKKCQVCDATTEKEAHKGGTATTTKKAVCEVCRAEYGDLKKEQPKPIDKITEDKKDDTKIVQAKKVVVNKKSIVLKRGKKVAIKAKLKPVNATEKVTFKSSNTKIAKVTKNGVIKAVKKGKCKVTVKTASGKKAVVKITVK